MKNLILNSLGICSFLLISSCKSNRTFNSQNSPSLSAIDSIAINNHFNGVILIAKDSTIQYEKAFGYSDLKNKTKLKTGDQFYIGSISKQITAVLILREYEKGNLKLSDKLDKYFSEISQPWTRQVTIHHLLTHTHGILEIDKPLEFEVGTQFHYSQIGFGLLAKILEKINHKSFEKLSTELFTQYRLKNTVHPDHKNYSNLVKGYEEDKNGEFIYATGNPVKYIAAGGFISNAEDILKWYQLLYNGRLVKDNSLALMKTRYATRNHPIFDKIEYGYGLLFQDGEQNIQIGAFGYSPGFPSAAYFYPRNNMYLIVLENIGYNLDDFKKTFKVHTDLMDLMKKNYK